MEPKHLLLKASWQLLGTTKFKSSIFIKRCVFSSYLLISLSEEQIYKTLVSQKDLINLKLLLSPEARGGSREDQPHVQGVVAARAQEGLEELSYDEGQEGRR